MNTFHVLVKGFFNSGKTCFIQALSEIDVVSTERGLRIGDNPSHSLPALDFGRLTLDENNLIYFFGAPASRRVDIDTLLQIFKRSIGLVCMVDSSKSETFREAAWQINREFIPSGLPYVVAINKQDKPDAWDAEAVRIALHIPPDIPVLPCSTRQTDTVKPVLLALFELWSKWGDDEPDAVTSF